MPALNKMTRGLSLCSKLFSQLMERFLKIFPKSSDYNSTSQFSMTFVRERSSCMFFHHLPVQENDQTKSTRNYLLSAVDKKIFLKRAVLVFQIFWKWNSEMVSKLQIHLCIDMPYIQPMFRTLLTQDQTPMDQSIQWEIAWDPWDHYKDLKSRWERSYLLVAEQWIIKGFSLH